MYKILSPCTLHVLYFGMPLLYAANLPSTSISVVYSSDNLGKVG